MARGGINKGDVKRARDSLLIEGVNPSIDAIRSELGNTGSKTTIHRYLKELEEEEGAQLNDEALLSSTLKDMVAKIASRLHQEANSIVELAKKSHTQRQIEWQECDKKQKHTILNSKNRIADQEKQLSELEQQLLALNGKLNETFTGAQRVEQKAADLEILIEEKNGQIQTLGESHQHVRENLEHYRQSVREQRDQDQRRHEQQVQQLQSEQRQSNQTLSVKLAEITQLNRDNVRLTEKFAANTKQLTSSSSRVSYLEGQLKSAEREAVLQSAQLEEKGKSIAIQAQNLSSLEGKLVAVENIRQSLDIKLAKLQVELKMKSRLLKKVNSKK